MARLFVILIVAGALSEAIEPPDPPLLIDPSPAAASPAQPLDVTD